MSRGQVPDAVPSVLRRGDYGAGSGGGAGADTLWSAGRTFPASACCRPGWRQWLGPGPSSLHHHLFLFSRGAGDGTRATLQQAVTHHGAATCPRHSQPEPTVGTWVHGSQAQARPSLPQAEGAELWERFIGAQVTLRTEVILGSWGARHQPEAEGRGIVPSQHCVLPPVSAVRAWCPALRTPHITATPRSPEGGTDRPQ